MPLVEDITISLIEQVLQTAVPDVTNVQTFDSWDGRVVTFGLGPTQQPTDTMQAYLAAARRAAAPGDGPEIYAHVTIKSHPAAHVVMTYDLGIRFPAHRRAEWLAKCNEGNQGARNVSWAILHQHEGNAGGKIVTRFAFPTEGQVSREFLATLFQVTNGEARGCQKWFADD